MKNEPFIAWLLPFLYAIHLFEEYTSGFPAWFSEFFPADLSEIDFIRINTVAMSLVFLNAVWFSFGKGNNFVLAVIGSVLGLNGILHLLSCLFTWSYSPGTLSGTILYIPLFIYTVKTLYPILPSPARSRVIPMAVFIHLIVILVANFI